MIEPKVDLLMGLQWGSEGKGSIAGYLAKRVGYDLVVTSNGPNSGHTFIDNRGKFVFKQLPIGALANPKAVLLGPGAIIVPSTLKKEIYQLRTMFKSPPEVRVHPNAAIVLDGHVAEEQRELNHIASTMQGTPAAIIGKIRRESSGYNNIAREMIPEWCCSINDYQEMVHEAPTVLVEGAQGYSLGIDQEFYPFVTSRPVTPARIMSDCAIPLGFLRRVIGVARTFPIRVGNTEGGFSGHPYGDQGEMDFKELGQEPEYTTVTNRMRRIFTWSDAQIHDAIRECQPNEIALTFANYARDQIPFFINTMNSLMQKYSPGGGHVRWTTWGPTEDDIQEIRLQDPCDMTRTELIEGNA